MNNLLSYCGLVDASRPVVPGCAGCAMEHPDFGRSVNPISTRGTDYAHLITACTPGFSDLPTALCMPKSSTFLFSDKDFNTMDLYSVVVHLQTLLGTHLLNA